MTRLRRLAILLLAAALPSFALHAGQEPLETLRVRVIQDLTAAVDWPTARRQAQAHAAAMGAQGAWPDVDYANRHVTLWPPRKHLERLHAIALVFGAEASGRFRDPALREVLLRGLAHWQRAYPRSANWWFNQFLAPQLLGETLLLAQAGGVGVGDLPPGLLARWAKEGGDPWAKVSTAAGANRMNLGEHWAYRGLLTGDEAVLDAGLRGLFDPLRLTDAEGLQRDLSFHQHGPQLYIGNYGYDWLALTAKWLARTRGTPFAPPAERARLARDYALETFFPAIRGEWFLYNAVGRQQASRPGDANARKTLPILRHLAQVFPGDAPAFEAIAARIRLDPAAPPPPARSRVYPCSDYALHVRPAFTFDVRANSVRTSRCEWGNDENLLGRFLSEGSTGFVARGDEYADIAPLWDWFKVPGTTAVDKGQDSAIPRGKPWGQRGTATLVGGVSDGVGALASAYRREGATPGCFAWFTLDDAVVCLGAGLSAADAGAPLVTTLEQCRRHGSIPDEALKKGLLETPAALVHGAFRYTAPKQKAALRVSLEARAKPWSRVSAAQPERAAGEVFTLWLDHGPAPTDAAYAYIVTPAASPPPDVTIVSNSPDFQSARDALGREAFVCYRTGRYRVGGAERELIAPCVGLLTEAGRLLVQPLGRTKENP